MMEVEFVQTVEDHIAYNEYQLAYQPWLVRNQFRLVAGFLVFVWVTTFLLEAPPNLGPIRLPDRVEWHHIAICVFLLVLIAVPVFIYGWGMRYAVRARVKRLTRNPENRKMLGWRRYVIGPEGVGIQLEGFSDRIMWGVVKDIAETEDHAFIKVSNVEVYFVPRRAFASDDEFREFVETARGYWDRAQYGLP
jgi:hypothetical protein